MSVMVVTGAFATHTTKLYNYYVCPRNFNYEDVEYIAVNYFNELKYIGRVTSSPIFWNYDGEIHFQKNENIDNEIRNDLNQFRSLLNNGAHLLFILSPILGGCTCAESLHYQGNGPFVHGHRYFDSLAEMLFAHQNTNAIGR
jgi:hypothetical protein